jgi:hypothetical protein
MIKHNIILISEQNIQHINTGMQLAHYPLISPVAFIRLTILKLLHERACGKWPLLFALSCCHCCFFVYIKFTFAILIYFFKLFFSSAIPKFTALKGAYHHSLSRFRYSNSCKKGLVVSGRFCLLCLVSIAAS